MSSTTIPPPLLFNPLKHHAGCLRERIVACSTGIVTLPELAAQSVILGGALMDLYIGSLTSADIAARIVGSLTVDSHLDPTAYREWLDAHGGYTVLTLADDGSRWVLRWGDVPERHVHIHPGRYSPATIRVRANVLRTALLVLAFTAVHGGDPLDRTLVNRVRRDYLDLAPLGRNPASEQGLGTILSLLQFPVSAERPSSETCEFLSKLP
jgi:hypothetical protein